MAHLSLWIIYFYDSYGYRSKLDYWIDIGAIVDTVEAESEQAQKFLLVALEVGERIHVLGGYGLPQILYLGLNFIPQLLAIHAQAAFVVQLPGVAVELAREQPLDLLYAALVGALLFHDLVED